MFNSTRMEKKKTTETPNETEAAAIAETRKLCSEIEVVIPCRHGEGLHLQMLSTLVTWVNAGITVTPMEDPLGGHLDIFRAHCCKEFLRQHRKRYMVFLDSDVVPMDPEGILRLCGHDLPVVSGIACAIRPGTGTFACVAVKDKTGVARFPTTMDTKVLPGKGIREVESCGAGIMAIRRDVLETIRGEPFLLSDELRLEACNIGCLRKSEDIYFCEQVQKAGFPMYVDFSVHAFHDKGIALHWPRELIDQDLDADEWDVTSRGLAVELR